MHRVARPSGPSLQHFAHERWARSDPRLNGGNGRANGRKRQTIRPDNQRLRSWDTAQGRLSSRSGHPSIAAISINPGNGAMGHVRTESCAVGLVRLRPSMRKSIIGIDQSETRIQRRQAEIARTITILIRREIVYRRAKNSGSAQ